MSVSLAAHHGHKSWTSGLISSGSFQVCCSAKFPINKSSVEYSAEPSWQTESGKISTRWIKILLVLSDTSGFTVSSLLLAELLHRKCPCWCINWVKMQRNETRREKQVINQVSRLSYLEVNTVTERFMKNKESLALVEHLTGRYDSACISYIVIIPHKLLTGHLASSE